jgi:hypothetical protein
MPEVNVNLAAYVMERAPKGDLKISLDHPEGTIWIFTHFERRKDKPLLFKGVESKRNKMAVIEKEVAEYFHVDNIRRRNRSRIFTRPRMIAYTLCLEIFPELVVAQFFNVDRSSVRNGRTVVQKDEELREHCDAIRSRVSRYTPVAG